MLLKQMHYRAIHAKALGATNEQAGKQAGVHPSTVARWMQNEIFKAKIQEVSEGSISSAVTAWNTLQRHAVQRAQQILADPRSTNMEVIQVIKLVADRLPPPQTPPLALLIDRVGERGMAYLRQGGLTDEQVLLRLVDTLAERVEQELETSEIKVIENVS